MTVSEAKVLVLEVLGPEPMSVAAVTSAVANKANVSEESLRFMVSDAIWNLVVWGGVAFTPDRLVFRSQE